MSSRKTSQTFNFLLSNQTIFVLIIKTSTNFNNQTACESRLVNQIKYQPHQRLTLQF